MNKRFFTISLAIVCFIANSKEVSKKTLIKVAVLDTGISPTLKHLMCDEGHKDFTGTGMEDFNGHGSHISGLIDQYARNVIFDSKEHNYNSLIERLSAVKINYCQIIIKYGHYSKDNKLPPMTNHMENYINALRYAVSLKPDIINISGGGEAFYLSECMTILDGINSGITFVIAAGNEGALIGVPNSTGSTKAYYPAMCDDEVLVVGSVDASGNKMPSSNYGPAIDIWELGYKVVSFNYKKDLIPSSGTSQATAIATGRLVRKILDSINNK